MDYLVTLDGSPIFSTFQRPPRVQVTWDPKLDPSVTKQSFKDECDINFILARYLKTGVLDYAQRNEPRYGDATGLDYQAALQLVAKAQSLFNELPAELRARFSNEPAEFLAFVQDEKNRPEAEALGLVQAKKAPGALPPPGGGAQNGATGAATPAAGEKAAVAAEAPAASAP